MVIFLGQHYFYRPSAISTAPPAGQGLESLARQRLKSHHTKNPNNVHMLDVLIYARIVHACVTARTPWAHSRCCTAAASGYVVRQSCTTHTTEDEDTKSSGLCTALPYKDISRSVTACSRHKVFHTNLRRCEMSQEVKLLRYSGSRAIAGSLLIIAGPHQVMGGNLKLASPA